MKESNKKALKDLMKESSHMSEKTKETLFQVSNTIFSEKKF